MSSQELFESILKHGLYMAHVSSPYKDDLRWEIVDGDGRILARSLEQEQAISKAWIRYRIRLANEANSPRNATRDG